MNKFGENDEEIVRIEDTKMPRVKQFKYLGSTVQENGNYEREVKMKVQARMEQMEKSIRSNL